MLVAYKINKVDMSDSISLLKKKIGRHHIFTVIVPDHFKRTIFPVFSILTEENSISNLKISIVHIIVLNYKSHSSFLGGEELSNTYHKCLLEN